MQATLKSKLSFTGVGLHSGADVSITLHPAAANYGIWFRRTDMPKDEQMVSARWDAVEQSPLCTRIKNADGVEVGTVEHLMAALAGCGVHNALIEIDGPEVPILDGSSALFVERIVAVGIRELDEPLYAIEVLKPVHVARGDAEAQLTSAETLEIDFFIDFADQAIGAQSKELRLANGTFVRELSSSRTFCRLADVEAMRANGLAKGGSLENAVVVDGGDVLTPGGLRHADEPVRHKMLDALGDLALAGAPILGRYTGKRAGHSLTNELLRTLFADPTSYRIVQCDAAQCRILPGAGLRQSDLPKVA